MLQTTSHASDNNWRRHTEGACSTTLTYLTSVRRYIRSSVTPWELVQFQVLQHTETFSCTNEAPYYLLRRMAWCGNPVQRLKCVHGEIICSVDGSWSGLRLPVLFCTTSITLTWSGTILELILKMACSLMGQLGHIVQPGNCPTRQMSSQTLAIHFPLMASYTIAIV